MALVLTQHEEGCLPFRRCRACIIADIISDTCTKEVMKIFNAETSRQFEPKIHLPGCSPINPCANCESVALLKKALPEGRFKLLLGLMNDSKPLEVPHREQDPSYAGTKNLLAKRVDELELSVRSKACLRNYPIIFVGDLCIKTEAEMLRMPNFGRKSLNEIKEVLALMELRLGMEFPPDMFQPT